MGARAFVFRPGPRVAGGRFVREIRTAGSATMLAAGTSRWRVPRETDHLAANLWLVERFGAHVRRDGPLVEVSGLGVIPSRSCR